jgi:hypothetical protein
VQSRHVEVVGESLLVEHLQDFGIVHGDAGGSPHVVNPIDIGLEPVDLPGSVKQVSGEAVESDADGLVFHRCLRALDGSLKDLLRLAPHLLVVMPRGSQADKLDLAPRGAQLRELPLQVVVEVRLPSVDSSSLAVREQLHQRLSVNHSRMC